MMSSPIKRKRTAPSYGRPVSASHDPVPVQQPGPLGTSSMAEATQLREELEWSLRGLRSSTSHIEMLISRLPPASPRPALSDLAAPAQATHDAPRPTEDVRKDHRTGPQAVEACSSCTALQQRVEQLEREAAEHEKEKDAWSAFKQWWLRSLAKKQRAHSKRSSRKTDPTAATSSRPSSPRRTSSGSLGAVFSKLDSASREVWLKAGIVKPTTSLPTPTNIDTNANASPTANADDTASASASAIQPSPSPALLGGGESGPSEPALPLAGGREVGWVDSTPVRSRVQRRSMLAHDCPDCAGFYAHLNGLGPQHRGDAERNACSRHRTTHARNPTPEGYWNIGFPSTQDAQLINDSARKNRPPP